ncbi:glycosyltransferase family A protein [Aliarcobacter skirrowii]|uniref:glycosyltransferase family 2 protein n=1 Tax=Aliarcobacter skirrowii TaxID=28200 RepID=UPI0029B8CE8C|nr:glycosyltransferase family A protein [Aliarcobacter skirrowii]MDX4065640.1 glycosyltransferase family A protein [Aliarcobacter skirrowii]
MIKDVTILIPTYNEERHIEQAILSAIHQAEFVVVSDNCSTDKTAEICKKLAKEYKNLIFYEQEQNSGNIKNIEFLCSKVKTKYMMNMGGHDILSKNYVEELKKTLEKNSNCVLAYPIFTNIDDESQVIGYYNVDELKIGVASTDVFTRVYTIINSLSNCSIFFGLARAEKFLNSCDYTPVTSIDKVFLCNLVSKGKFIQNTNTTFYRRYPTRTNNNQEYMKRISGETKIDYDLSYMCKKQFELISNLSYVNKEKRNYFLELAKKSLQRKFSKKCTEEINSKINILNKSDEKFILYGAGTISELVLERISHKIEYIVDKDEKKHNRLSNGILVKNIESIFNSNLRVIITVLNETIFDELVSIGIEYERLISLNILDKININR